MHFGWVLLLLQPRLWLLLLLLLALGLFALLRSTLLPPHACYLEFSLGGATRISIAYMGPENSILIQTVKILFTITYLVRTTSAIR